MPTGTFLSLPQRIYSKTSSSSAHEAVAWRHGADALGTDQLKGEGRIMGTNLGE